MTPTELDAFHTRQSINPEDPSTVYKPLPNLKPACSATARTGSRL